MNLKNILKISAIIIGLGVVSTPFIYQQQINKSLELTKQELAQNNISLKEKSNNDSYITLNREYILTIEDSTYLIKKLYPEIDPYTLEDLKTLLDNSKLLIKLNLTKYPIYHKNAITISLLSLNEKLSKDLSNDKMGLQLLEFIKNKGLTAFVDINNLDIAKAKLKDINLKLSNNKEFLKFVFLNSYMEFDNKDIKTHISDLSLELKDSENILFKFQNINHNIMYQNEFNYKTNLVIDKINVKSIGYSDNTDFIIQNLDSHSKVSSTLNRLNLENNIKFQNLTLNEKNSYSNNKLELNNFKFNLKLEKIDLNSLKKLSLALQKQDYTNIERYIQKIVNKGFTLKISPISLQKANLQTNNQNINISKIGIDFNAIIKSNNIDIDKIDTIFDYLNADLHIITTKENIELLQKLVPISTLYLQNIIVEKNNHIMINLSYKNNTLLSNGKKLF